MNAEVQINDLTITAVPPNMISFVWKQVEPIIQRVIDQAPDDLSMDNTLLQLMKGNWLLIVVNRGEQIVAANVADVRTTETGLKYLYLPIVGGDELDEWVVPFIEVVKNIGRDYGCERIRGIGRKGWTRKLKPLGWKEVFHTVETEI